MITLQNLGDSILFTFDENDKYLNNGTISVPMNSLILVTDDSEMATFRKAASNDIFVSALYSDFGMTKAELEEWYAENMVSEVTEEDVDEKIAEAVGEESERAISAETSLSGAISAVDAAYKAADSVISGAVDNLSTALQNEAQRAISAETALSGAIDTKIDESAITSAITSASTDSEIPSAKAVYDALQESGLDEDTEKLISGSLNDLNERKLDASAYTPTDLTNYYTKSETSGATEIATALNAKQDTLIAGDNITISGNVISAEGGGKAISAGTNISVTTGETADTINCTLPISAGTNGNGIILRTDCTASVGAIASGYKANAASRSIVFGYSSSTNASDSIVVGQYNSIQRSGHSGFALGASNIVSTYGIGALGSNLISNAQSEVSCGRFNISRGNNYMFGLSGDTLFSIGNGTAASLRHNAFEIRGNGDIYIADTNDTTYQNYYEKPMIKLQDALGGGGSTFDENYPVLEKESSIREVQGQSLASFIENSIYVKPYEGYNECTITISGNIDGNEYEATVNLYLTGSTVYSLDDGESALLDYVTIQRDNGYIKITLNNSDALREVSNNTRSEFYFVPYEIESGTTEDAIKQAAQKTLDEAIYNAQHYMYSIDNLSYDNEDLRLYYSNGIGEQSSVYLLDFLTKDGEIYNNNGLKIKPIVNSGTTTWSTILEVPDGKDYSDYHFPYFIDGTYKKFRVYYNSGVTFDDGEEIHIFYNNSQGVTYVYFYYDGNQDTFVTENQDFTCTKQNYYLEFEYTGSDSSLRWKAVYFYNHSFNKSELERIDVYGKQLLNLQEAYESVSNGGGSSYTAGDGIDITNDVISVTGKVDTSAFTAHTADTTIHVTSSDKTSWNGAATNASNAITALGGLSLVKLTQAAYDALATKDSNTLYIING